MKSSQQKIVLIVGAASGIGAATAKRFVEDGFNVIIAGLPAHALQNIATQLKVKYWVCDVRDEPAIQTMMCDVISAFGKIDILINAAGILINDHAGSIQDTHWQSQLDVNLTGAMRLMRKVLPHMQDQKSGCIINIASVAALNAEADLASYAASKAGLVALTRSAASHYGGDGIRINAICPGWVDTPMSQKEMHDLAAQRHCSVDEAKQRTVQSIALGRMAAPSEIASVCAFLASSDASFITGTALIVDGGTC